jgi:hypothetical protein
MDQELTKTKWSDLLFGVRRSIRYHSRRRKFFDALKVWADFLIIVSGGTVVAFASADEPKHKISTLIVGAVIAVIGSFDLVIGFSTKARDYHDLVKAFSALEREMTAVSDKKTSEDLKRFTNRRLEIEEEEPTILRVLNNYCHNELCRATGKEHEYHVEIGIFQTCFKQWFDWMPARMKTHGEIAKLKEAKAKAKPCKATSAVGASL